jgi:hypothetical protein
MVAGSYNSSNSRHSRPWEVARSGPNERGQCGDSIPYLTYRGDASWWLNFIGEEAAAGLLRAVAPSAHPGGGLQGGKHAGARAAHRGRQGVALGKAKTCRGATTSWWRTVVAALLW